MKYIVLEVRPGQPDEVVEGYDSYEDARAEAARCNRVGDFSYYAIPKEEKRT